MDEQFAEGNFLGLPDQEGPADVVIASIPYELTTSYGQGTAEGPAACIEASGQVELFDDLLDEELPAGRIIRTVEPWDGEEHLFRNSLQASQSMLSGNMLVEHFQYSLVANMVFSCCS